MRRSKRVRWISVTATALAIGAASLFVHAQSQQKAVTGPADKALIHRPLLLDPYVPRLTESVTQQYYGKRLFGMEGDVLQVLHQRSSGAPLQNVVLTLDLSWTRIVHSQDFNVVKAWGHDDPDGKRNLRIPRAMDANTGQWDTGNDYIQLFVVETRRVLRLSYSYTTQEILFSDSLSVDADSLSFLQDCGIQDNGTPGDWWDDSLWVLDVCNSTGRNRLIQYPCNTSTKGIHQSIDLPTGTGGREIEVPRKFALGRDPFSGANTSEIYIVDAGSCKIVQFRINGANLIYENDYSFGKSEGPQRYIIVPSDVTVDCYGQVYVSAMLPDSRIYKFTPDLKLLHMFNREGSGPDEITEPDELYNSRPTIDYVGFDNLLVSELWSPESGAQRYAIGVKASLTATVDLPHSIELFYDATDPHDLTVEVARWQGGVWVPFDTVPYGLKFSGATSIEWNMPAAAQGFDYLYRFRLVAHSTYVPADGSEPFADTVEYEVTMGNEDPHIVAPLRIDSLENGCMVIGRAHTATIKVQDDDTPGSLTYTWSSDWGRLEFWNPSAMRWDPILVGPWDSVGVRLKSTALQKTSAQTLPQQAKPHVQVDDAGGGHVEEVKSFGYCNETSDPGCSHCPSSVCECPCLGDINCDGVSDIVDMSAAIDIVFFGAFNPYDPSCALGIARSDFDCDGTTDALDISHFIDYVFFGGAGPCNPCNPQVGEEPSLQQ